MKRKIRMGMVGGGQGSFIGAVHRIAANLDGQIELVCGCFSSRPENSLATGQSLFLPDNRIYASYQEMIEKGVGVVGMVIDSVGEDGTTDEDTVK